MIIILILIGGLIACGIWFGLTFITVDKDYQLVYDEKGNLKRQGYEIENYKALKLKAADYYSCKRICKKKIHLYQYWSLDEEGLIPTIVSGFLTLTLIVTGMVCLINRGPVCVAHTEVAYQVRIDDLKDKERNIYLTLNGEYELVVSDQGTVYHVVVDKPVEMMREINEYNSEVKALKQDLYLEKVSSESPWISWFVNPGFKHVEGYNESATSYKTILGEDLKTFELNNH